MYRLFIFLVVFVLPSFVFASFTQDLSIGESNPEVQQLQEFLNKSGYSVTNYGEETTYFGPLTRMALTQYQVDHAGDILGGNGALNDLGTLNVLTRQYLNARSSNVLGAMTGVNSAQVVSSVMQTLTVKVSGVGTVTTSSGQTCSLSPCVFTFPYNTKVTLTASPGTGSAFSTWSGGCSGSATSCTVTMSRNRSVTANFAAVTASESSWTLCAAEYGTCNFSGTRRVLYGVSPTSQNTIGTYTDSVWCDNHIFGDPAETFSKSCWYESISTPPVTPVSYTLTTGVSGNGSISGAGINCGTDCTEDYISGTSITLTATPATGYTFSGWSGVCSGTATTCAVSVTSRSDVSASFTATPLPTPTNTRVNMATPSTYSSIPGGTVNILLNWERAPMAVDYLQFMHLSNDGNSVSVDDHTVKSSSWSGSAVDTRSITIPSSLAVGTYDILVGLSGGSPWKNIELLTGSGVTNVGDNKYKVGTLTVAAKQTPINGVCGTSNNLEFTVKPSTNLCTTGTASSVSGTGPWSWSCAGIDGGTTASCKASLEVVTSTTQPSTPVVVSTKFTQNSRVSVTSALNVRGIASVTGSLLGTQSVGSLGTIIGGPTAQGGYNWWQVNYDSGVDGWSVEDYLMTYVAPSTAATWTLCAVENGTCTFSGTRRVLYGVSTSYQNTIGTHTGSVSCSNGVFGDPAETFGKYCWYENVTTTSAPTPTPTTVQPTSPVTTTPPSGGNVGPTISTFTPSGPITVSSNQTVTGKHITNPNGPCITGNNVTNVTITNNKIGPCGPDENGVGVSMETASEITITHNSFDDVASGFYINGYSGGGSNIVFKHNHVTRVRGPFPRGQMVQFNGVKGSGNEIMCNVSDQTSPGYLGTKGTGPEDHINMYASQGTKESPIRYAFNKLRGGGPSISGGGSLAGDGDGAYVIMESNIVVDPGQYGIAVAGGNNIKMNNNIVYSPTAHPWSNIGAYIWNQYPQACFDIEAKGNRVFYRNKDGNLNAGWNANNCTNVTGWNTDNVWNDSSLTAAVWDTVFPECQ